LLASTTRGTVHQLLHVRQISPQGFWFGGTLLAHANIATNPIIYVAFHSEYRKQLKVILRCACFPICAGLGKARTGNVLNIQGEGKAGKMEEFDMVNVFSSKMN